uniref:Ribosomal protein L5 n=1 Tax=Rhodomonas salina TaxID=3034 RepID=Q9G8W5_RHDSA|nr:ribosomal protein L5 [Rhodomonas salina]AAG17732.1 ribosomal protein L5 [Rhodomonas salina]
MNNIEIWNKKILAKDILYKKRLLNIFNVPHFENICLRINNKKEIPKKQSTLLSFGLLKVLTNQEPKICFAKKSIVNFKIQKEMPLGCKLTLRKERKNLFLEMFLIFIFPNIQTELKKSGNGFNIGVKSLLLLPQLTIVRGYNLNNFGFNITFNLNTKNFDLILSGFQIRRNYEKTKN